MFKKYPYWGWLFIAFLCWSITLGRFYSLRQMARPESMARIVGKDLQNRQKALDIFLANKRLVQKMFSDSLDSDEVDKLSKEPFHVYAFKGDLDLIFWNNNTVVGTCNGSDSEKTDGLYRNNGVYYRQCLHPRFLAANEHLVVLFPIQLSYPIQNEYLLSHFVAADYIPVSTGIEKDEKTAKSIAVNNGQGKTLFYLSFQQQDLPRYIPDSLLGCFFLAAILFTILWFHLLAIVLAKEYAPIYGFALIGLSVTAILLSAYLTGIPFYFNELLIFSPGLYASSKVFPSLGMLLLVLLCMLWVMIYVAGNFKQTARHKKFHLFHIVPVAICVLLIVSCGVAPVNLIRNIVIDSRISFDVSDFSSVNVYTLIGLFTIVIILCCNTLILYYSNSQLNAFLKKRFVKYVVLASALFIYFVFAKGPVYGCQYFHFITVFLLVVIFDYLFEGKQVRLFSPQILFTGILIAIAATALLQHFNTLKGKTNRRSFAERIVRQRDIMMEYLFNDIADSIGKDFLLSSYFQHPIQGDRSFIDEHITTRYLRGQLNRYQTGIYFFDKHSKPIYNQDSLGIREVDSFLKQGTLVTESSYLYYFENAKDARYYTSKIPLHDEGFVVLTLQLKKAVNASVYPELLQPARIKTQALENYTYGIYAERELITQSNEYPFPFYLRTDTLKVGEYKVLKREGYNVNIYKIDARKRVTIIDTEQRWLELITLFSYILGMLLVCVLVAASAGLYFKYLHKKTNDEKIIQLTLRNRIHFAMLSVVMISFLIIGAVTIFVFIDRYDNSNKVKLRTAMQLVERSVQEYFKNEKIRVTSSSFHEETQKTKFKTYISNLANREKLDINIYNSFGSLNATSQEDIYNKALLARIMMPKAYYELSDLHRVLLVEKEVIGELDYLSGYVPLRNIDAQAVGFINVPFFSSQKELNYQISNILVALINLYAFIFLISSILAVGITNWLTKGLRVLIERFKTFDLKQNETIAWNYDDEIGILIHEYNKMVETVVENAKRLAQSEREMAWREMAKQVAHEIKNPLTPMKLNIQYLQQAMQKNLPNIQQLTQSVSDSIIEQIDNLSHIASAFSDFAKMPEAVPEDVTLNEVLKNAVDLYSNSSKVDVQFKDASAPLVSYVDKSQLLRVFNNLLQNATEAIPEDRATNIVVTLKSGDGKALIAISDNGSGIADDKRDRIFSPYFTTKGSGTGLGLAMTKKIIEFWSGRIWFETEERIGTTFFIELPIRED